MRSRRDSDRSRARCGCERRSPSGPTVRERAPTTASRCPTEGALEGSAAVFRRSAGPSLVEVLLRAADLSPGDRGRELLEQSCDAETSNRPAGSPVGSPKSSGSLLRHQRSKNEKSGGYQALLT